MKRIAIALLLTTATAISAWANVVPSNKETEDPFNCGVTGIMASLKMTAASAKTAKADDPHKLVVSETIANTPAAGKFQAGDVLTSVNGVSLSVVDPRHPLGEAINVAEGKDGKMTFGVLRGDRKLTVTIQIEPIGSYSPTWPINCAKSKKIVDQTAKFILDHGGPEGGITGSLEALFLMSTGEEKYMPVVKKYAEEVASKPSPTSTWMIGYSGIFLGEYYLRTGDKRVLPALKARCDKLAAGQWFGGWGHGTDHCGPGYVTGGTLNAAGDQGLTTMVIARECGVKVNENAYNKAIIQFSRFAGRGGVPYGDHHPELWWASNGKNGGLASALTLLPQKKFQGGAKLLALSETDSYWGSEGGHGSCFGNHTWRTIVDVLVMDHPSGSWRRHKDKMMWYLEMSRMPGGGFHVPHPGGHKPIGKAPHYQTGLLAMAYTAHLHNLRICGKPRTKYSVEYKPTAGEQAVEDDDFTRTDWVDGVVVDIDPDKIAEVFTTVYKADGTKSPQGAKASINSPNKKKMPAEWYFKIMHHYGPQPRDWAAHGLGYLGAPAIPYIKKALASKDSRLRAAGFDAISCTTGWGSGKCESGITPEMIKEHFLGDIVRTLKDKSIPMWEHRLALMALSCCDAETIKANVEVVPSRTSSRRNGGFAWRPSAWRNR